MRKTKDLQKIAKKLKLKDQLVVDVDDDQIIDVKGGFRRAEPFRRYNTGHTQLSIRENIVMVRY